MQEFKEVLLGKKQELERRIKNIGKHQVLNEKSSDEAAIEMQNDEVLQGLDDGARAELEAIDNALARIENQTYDICVGCGLKIPLKRLEANPFSKQCIDCAAGKDKQANIM